PLDGRVLPAVLLDEHLRGAFAAPQRFHPVLHVLRSYPAVVGCCALPGCSAAPLPDCSAAPACSSRAALRAMFSSTSFIHAATGRVVSISNSKRSVIAGSTSSTST